MHTRDGHIVHQCLSGNTEAFALLVDKYKGRIFALVYAKVGQFQDAEDITQDVFLNAYKKLSTLRRWDNFYPWLYSIAANRCKNFYRAQKEQVETMNLLARNLNHQAAVDADSESVKIEQLHEALASLPEMHCQVLVLRYMAGMKSKEIAQTLRVSPNTIDQRLVRARAKLKTILSEEMIPMIRTAFAERRLQPGFTARVVELISEAKIQTAPHKTALPLGLSAAGGVILLLLSLSLPHSPLYPLGVWLGGYLPLKTQVVEDGELPVDAEATRVMVLGAEGESGTFGQKPEPLKTPAAVGQPDEMDNPNEEIMVTEIRLPDEIDHDNPWGIDISPDGTKMVYSVDSVRNSPTLSRSFFTQLILQPVVNLSTHVSPESTVLLQEDAASYSTPKWSPDGKWIAFYRREFSQEDSQHYDVYLALATGGEKRFLVTTEESRRGISWSPGSKELAFVKGKKKKTNVHVVSIETGKIRPFTTDGKENENPVWSGDGKWITYSSRRGIWLGDGSRNWIQPIDGGKAKLVKDISFRSPIFSPDGRWMAHMSRLPDGIIGLFVSRVNSQGELTGKPTLIKTVNRVYAKFLRWTSGGKIFCMQHTSGTMTYAVNLENGGRHLVSTDPQLRFGRSRWLSDGKRLFLPSGSDGKPGFFNLETNEFIKIPLEVSSDERIGNATLSPDERAVAFTRLNPKNVGPIKGTASGLPMDGVHVYVLPVTGGQIRQLTGGKLYADELQWSPDGQEIVFISNEIGAVGSFKSKLCVVSVTDGQVKVLTDSDLCLEPTWSPDGTALTYLQLKKKGMIFNPDEMEGDLYVVPAAGGESKRITNTPEKELGVSWMPDGKRLTFMIEGEVWVASIDGGEAKKLQKGYIPSSWSSDGMSYLAIGRNGELQRVSLDDTTINELPFRVPKDARPLSMSPDGETILYRQITSGTQCWSIDVSHLVNQ